MGNPKEKCFCDICGLEVKEVPELPCDFERTINAAVLGESLEVRGHRTCLENVNNLIVIPNRARLLEIMEGIKVFLKFLDDSQSQVKANPDPPRVSPGKPESAVQHVWNRRLEFARNEKRSPVAGPVIRGPGEAKK